MKVIYTFLTAKNLENTGKNIKKEINTSVNLTQSSANYGQQADRLFFVNQLCWDTATPICLLLSMAAIHTTIAEFSSSDRNRIALQNLKCLLPGPLEKVCSVLFYSSEIRLIY